MIRDQLEALGWDAREATDHAALACYVGNMQMAHVRPSLSTAAARRRQVDLMFEFLVNR